MLDGGEKLVWDKARDGRAGVRRQAGRYHALVSCADQRRVLRRRPCGPKIIDYYLVGGHAFYAQQEIFDIVNLLRAVASPCDEVSLVGVLRSPMFGILDETLYHLSKHREGLAGGLWRVLDSLECDGLPSLFNTVADTGEQCVLKSGGKPPHSKDELARVRFAAETLAELRAEKDRMPVAQLIHKALEQTGYDAMLLAEFLGERKLANLHKLIEQARQFDAAGIFTLADFITQLAQFVARQPDEPLAATQPESIQRRAADVDSSVERSGVSCRGRGRCRSAAAPGRRRSRVHAGTGTDGAHERLHHGYELSIGRNKTRSLTELTRLLYVAATRAGDYLIFLPGMDRSRSSPIGRGPNFYGGTSTCIREHRRPLRIVALVRITSEEPALPHKVSSGRSKATT